MDIKQAFQIVTNVVNLAQSRGILKLEDVPVILEALKTLQPEATGKNEKVMKK